MPSSLPLLLLLAAIHFLSSDAAVHDYASARFAAKGNAFVLHGGSEGIRGSSGEGNGSKHDSFVRFEKLLFRRPQDDAASIKENDVMLVQAILFEVEDRETIGGSAYGGQRAICCTPDLAKLGVCTQDTVIYRPSPTDPNWPQVITAAFKGNDLVASLPFTTIHITRSGMYNLYFIYCDPKLKGLVTEGKTIWKNPTGYLPGRMAPVMSFYEIMSLVYVIIAAFWFSQYARFWKEILPLQNCITLVIALSMFEMTMWYFEYAEFNKTGVRPVGITIWAATFGTIKRTISRVLILVVSMGYGVVRPTLVGLSFKVVMLGSTFFFASEVLELVENVGAISDLSGKARLLLSLPVALLDAFFIIWIFTSLSKTLDKLQARRLIAKLHLYRKFTNALVAAVIVSVGWICYEIYFKCTDVYNERWQTAWIIPIFWHLLSLTILIVICVLWRPSQNSRRYAYDANEEFDREQTLTLIKPGPSHNKDSTGSSPDAKTTSRDVAAAPLDEDFEEDKRE